MNKCNNENCKNTYHSDLNYCPKCGKNQYQNIKVEFPELLSTFNKIAENLKKEQKDNNVKKNITISKEDFVFWIDYIKNFNNELLNTEDKISEIFNDDFFGTLKIAKNVDKIIQWLCSKVNDQEDDDTISWWLYECECVFEKDQDWTITFANTPHQELIVNTPEQLYDFYVECSKREV